MSPIIDVEPAAWDAASNVFGHKVVEQLTHAVVGLKQSLAETAGMAGTDPGGTAWASAYDPAAKATSDAMTDLTKASYKVADLLEQTGFNHAVANSASDPTGRTPTPPDTTNYQAPSTLSCDPDPPSAKGGSGHPPKGWGLVEHLVGYVWPNGDQGKLRKASHAWVTAADTLDGGAYDIPEALVSIRTQKCPEVDDAVTVCEAMMGHIHDGSSACRELSTACDDLADHIDKAHNEIEHELIVLLEWTIAIEAAGAVASFFSFGAAEIPTQAAEAGRIAATAGRIATIISKLVEFAGTVAARIGSIMSKIGEILGRLKTILNLEKRGADATKAAGAVDKEVNALAKLQKTADEIGTPRGAAGSLNDLTAAQLKNYQRYESKLPSKHEPVSVERLPDGGARLSSRVPADNIPGSYAEYIKVIDKDGVTTQYVKNTYAPDGTIVHSKLK